MLYNMKELLTIAKENKFAVPAFNIGSLENTPCCYGSS